MAQNFQIATFANNITAANSTGLYYSGSINATSHTVGTSTVANSTGVYTGVVNAASHTVGTSFTVNTTIINVNFLGFYANGTLGSSGQYLASNGSATYWTTGLTTGKSIAMAIVFGG